MRSSPTSTTLWALLVLGDDWYGFWFLDIDGEVAVVAAASGCRRVPVVEVEVKASRPLKCVFVINDNHSGLTYLSR
jgi:hypothetical protein